jgi:hypothetical protein
MRYQFGDVVLVPFPFTDQSTAKQRPGVIVSSAAYHDARRDLILMAVTSQVRGAGAFGELVVRDWQTAKLLKPSASSPCSRRSSKPSSSRRSAGSPRAISSACARPSRRFSANDRRSEPAAVCDRFPVAAAPGFSLSRFLLSGPIGTQKPPAGYPAYLEERHDTRAND